MIEIHTNSFRSVRGRSILCAVLDECAFFRDENFALPDVELDAALSPGLARVPGSMKILISSVHKRSGLPYQRYRDYFGKDNDDILVVYGTTLQFNPSFDEDIIERAFAEDPERYGAEYLSKWRDDLSTWLSRELLDAAVDRGVCVRAPASNINYIAGCDASSGRNDSFTAAIAHRERARYPEARRIGTDDGFGAQSLPTRASGMALDSDSASSKSFFERYPDARRIGRV